LKPTKTKHHCFIHDGTRHPPKQTQKRNSLSLIFLHWTLYTAINEREKLREKERSWKGCVNIYQINSFVPDLFQSYASFVPSHDEPREEEEKEKVEGCKKRLCKPETGWEKKTRKGWKRLKGHWVRTLCPQESEGMRGWETHTPLYISSFTKWRTLKYNLSLSTVPGALSVLTADAADYDVS